MVDLGQLSQSNAYAQTSGPGFGTRMLCRPLDEHDDAPVDGSMWLTGLRRANALSMNTNPIPNAHMRSPGGFMEFFAGLRDPGDIQFEACWKNDVPKGATPGSDASATLDFQRWQAPKEGDSEGNKGLFHSLFYDREPFEAWVIPPQWTRALIIVRGYASMVGPFPHEMEGVINFQGSFKASGKPMILRGVKVGGLATVALAAKPIVPDDTQMMTYANYRYRAIREDLLEEIWTPIGAAGMVEPIFAESATLAKDFQLYQYLEDAGFGDAF